MNKKEIRNKIKQLKKEHTMQELDSQSEMILSKLEKHKAFKDANIVMLYASLPDEVNTHSFIEKWRNKKHIILTTVSGDDIIHVE